LPLWVSHGLLQHRPSVLIKLEGLVALWWHEESLRKLYNHLGRLLELGLGDVWGETDRRLQKDAVIWHGDLLRAQLRGGVVASYCTSTTRNHVVVVVRVI
jgi:hypothetical protein